MARPAGVTILSVLAFLGGLLSLALGGLFLFDSGYVGRLSGMPNYIASVAPRFAATFITVAILDLLIAYGLFGLANWARVLTMICAAISLLAMAVGIARMVMQSEPYLIPRDSVVAVIDLLVLFYLSRPRVRQAFSRRPAAAQPPASGTPATSA